MSLFRFSSLLGLAGAAFAGTLLFWTSQNVQMSEDRLAGLRDSVRTEKQSIRVLRAEWDYLNRPDRLERLARDYLSYEIVGSEDILSSDEGDDEGQILPFPIFHATSPASGLKQQEVSFPSAQPLPSKKPKLRIQSSPQDDDLKNAAFYDLLEQVQEERVP